MIAVRNYPRVFIWSNSRSAAWLYIRRLSLPVEKKYIRGYLLCILLFFIIIGCDNSPLIEITKPVDGALVNGFVNIIAQTASSSALDSIQFYIDGEFLASVQALSDVYVWDASSFLHGTLHNMSAIGFFANGIIAESDMISVTVYSHRTVLAEVFGEYEWPGYGWLAEHVLLDSLSHYQDTLAVICYHTYDPYALPAAYDRLDYYDLSSYATQVVFDGTDINEGYIPIHFREEFEQSIDSARTLLPKFVLLLDAHTNATSGTVGMSIIPCTDIPNGDINVFLCICEDSLDGYFGSYRRVVRDLYQFPLVITPTDTFDTTIFFSHDFSLSKMSAVVFIQDLDTREILQAIFRGFY